ncbi:hypothetical protein GGE50_004330 [Rhizobium leguminosarum]|nr:hypothetical protein [Rhizobium leguminosarum]MBB4344293.1 hypothetical protein [Rhizobium leguminosarum]MBB4355944.1 hypothetical protein [Rhizobium leguminosarum]MBB4549034.1 hypothetical protein [Rhizobium leguminosarum]MBB4588421.1 hypothetical protein [Rhizobium leguminosarum]
MSATAMTAAITPKLYASANNGLINSPHERRDRSFVAAHIRSPSAEVASSGLGNHYCPRLSPYRKNLVAMRSLVIRLSETINS